MDKKVASVSYKGRKKLLAIKSIVEGSEYHQKDRNASLGVRSFQNWLIENLSTFKKRTGISGYAFDYTFLWYEGTSTYAQWWGWRRVMETLRERFPNIVMDGRQLYHEYGPWIWLAGSYPHPTASDEQPESFEPFPDMHFDRVSANRQRFTAYRYRLQEYAPPELMPGFITHQTPRYDHKGRLVRGAFRIRDWDYLGWKYSLISSIATAGLNNIVSMIPARDPEEYRNFSEKDKEIFRFWLEWTERNSEYLHEMRPIIGQPAIGHVDGTSAIIEDEGFVFLFNPNGRAMDATFTLDESIGLQEGDQFVLIERYPVKSRRVGKPNSGIWDYGDKVTIPMDGARAMMVKISPASGAPSSEPRLFNVSGQVQLNENQLGLTQVQGEVGTSANALVRVPEGRNISSVRVNGTEMEFRQNGRLVSIPLRFAGQAFHHMQQVGEYDPDFTGGTTKATFTIPERILEQLEERRDRWPIPWSKRNYQTPWLVPERLPLFVQIAEPADTMDVKLKIDGAPVELKKAYTSVRSHSPTFVGFYVDVSPREPGLELEPGREYTATLSLPELERGQFQGLFFENVITEYTGNVQSRDVGQAAGTR